MQQKSQPKDNEEIASYKDIGIYYATYSERYRITLLALEDSLVIQRLGSNFMRTILKENMPFTFVRFLNSKILLVGLDNTFRLYLYQHPYKIKLVYQFESIPQGSDYLSCMQKLNSISIFFTHATETENGQNLIYYQFFPHKKYEIIPINKNITTVLLESVTKNIIIGDSAGSIFYFLSVQRQITLQQNGIQTHYSEVQSLCQMNNTNILSLALTGDIKVWDNQIINLLQTYKTNDYHHSIIIYKDYLLYDCVGQKGIQQININIKEIKVVKQENFELVMTIPKVIASVIEITGKTLVTFDYISDTCQIIQLNSI